MVEWAVAQVSVGGATDLEGVAAIDGFLEWKKQMVANYFVGFDGHV